MPPFWAPEIVTGPLAVLSWMLPVAPGLKFDGVSPTWPELLPEPPQAASVSRPTEERATSGVFSLMYAPFAEMFVSTSARRDAPGATRAVGAA